MRKNITAEAKNKPRNPTPGEDLKKTAHSLH